MFELKPRRPLLARDIELVAPALVARAIHCDFETMSSRLGPTNVCSPVRDLNAI